MTGTERQNDASREPRPFMPHTFRTTASGAIELVAGRCAECGAMEFPRTPFCPSCGSAAIDDHGFSDGGTIHAHTEVHQSRPGFATPYRLATIDFPGGLRVVGRVLDRDAVSIGDAVDIELAHLRIDATGRDVVGVCFRTRGEERPQ